MFRLFLISLICGITAKPLKPLNKIADAAFQDTIMSRDELSWGVQVEPPQDMDVMDYDIDPSMKIWKSMTGTGQDAKYLKAEEDMDDLHHPSIADLLKGQPKNQDTFPVVDIQSVPLNEADSWDYQVPEQDQDQIYHRAREELDRYLAPLVAKGDVATEVRVHTKPEEDMDDLYHDFPHSPVHMEPLGREVRAETGVRLHLEPEEDMDDLYHDFPHSPMHMEPLGREVRAETGVRLHLEPEEDMDDLYHADQLKPVPYHADADAAVPADVPSQRKHSQPEEDLDDLYHR